MMGTRKLMKAMATALCALVVIPLLTWRASASVITTPSLVPYYGAANFNPALTINYLTPIFVYDHNELQSIDTDAEVTQLFALPGQVVLGRIGNGPIGNITLPSSPTIDLFYVDILAICGGSSPVVGCAQRPGSAAVVPAPFVAGANGAEDIAHEIGHNFGLRHCEDAANAVGAGGPGCAANDLMTAAGFGNPNLNAAQVAIVLASVLVQGAAPNQFVNITPITFVPEPGTFLLLSGPVMLLAARRRKAVSLTE